MDLMKEKIGLVLRQIFPSRELLDFSPIEIPYEHPTYSDATIRPSVELPRVAFTA